MPAAPTEEALWQEYRTRLVRFVARRVEDEPTAEDIVHDVLLRAYQKRETLRAGGSFERWLYQITRNAVIDHYRARKPPPLLPPDLAQADADAEGSARRELAACMTPFVESLPEHYREAIVLAELGGLTQREAATRMGLSLSGAKSRVQRARRMLAEKVLACCRVELDGRGSIMSYESRCDCGGRSSSPGSGPTSCGGVS